jgi:hypothetical protein
MHLIENSYVQVRIHMCGSIMGQGLSIAIRFQPFRARSGRLTILYGPTIKLQIKLSHARCSDRILGWDLDPGADS